MISIEKRSRSIKVMPTKENLPILLPQNKIKEFCQQYKIQKLSLFVSVLRNDFTPESDLDFLVEFLPEAKITYEVLLMDKRQ